MINKFAWFEDKCSIALLAIYRNTIGSKFAVSIILDVVTSYEVIRVYCQIRPENALIISLFCSLSVHNYTNMKFAPRQSWWCGPIKDIFIKQSKICAMYILPKNNQWPTAICVSWIYLNFLSHLIFFIGYQNYVSRVRLLFF